MAKLNQTSLLGAASRTLAMVFCAVFFFAMAPASGEGESPSSSFQDLLPGLVYNFAKFVDWPDTPRPKADEATFYIGVCSASPERLQRFRALEGMALKGKTIRIIRVDGQTLTDDLRRLQVIFTDSPDFLKDVGSGNVRGHFLLATTVEGSASSGVAAVEFGIADEVPVFEIALPALKASKLQADASLLNLAQKLYR